MSEQSYLRAAHTVESARSLVIDASHQMPSNVPKELITEWMELDARLHAFAEMLHKVHVQGTGVARADGKICKPANFTPPDMTGAVCDVD